MKNIPTQASSSSITADDKLQGGRQAGRQEGGSNEQQEEDKKKKHGREDVTEQKDLVRGETNIQIMESTDAATEAPEDTKDAKEVALPPSPSSGSSIGRKNRKRNYNKTAFPEYKKAPQAPKRPKSAYMFFSTEKHKEIRKDLEEKGGQKMKTPEVAKLVSEAWKNQSPEERKMWDDIAEQDKRRYEHEKSTYRGPWRVQVDKGRPQDDPNFPKKPSPAFFTYSNERRLDVRRRNPGASNADVSKILSRMWKEAPEEEKQPHYENERRRRKEYQEAKDMWHLARQAEQESPMTENIDHYYHGSGGAITEQMIHGQEMAPEWVDDDVVAGMIDGGNEQDYNLRGIQNHGYDNDDDSRKKAAQTTTKVLTFKTTGMASQRTQEERKMGISQVREGEFFVVQEQEQQGRFQAHQQQLQSRLIQQEPHYQHGENPFPPSVFFGRGGTSATVPLPPSIRERASLIQRLQDTQERLIQQQRQQLLLLGQPSSLTSPNSPAAMLASSGGGLMQNDGSGATRQQIPSWGRTNAGGGASTTGSSLPTSRVDQRGGFAVFPSLGDPYDALPNRPPIENPFPPARLPPSQSQGLLEGNVLADIVAQSLRQEEGVRSVLRGSSMSLPTFSGASNTGLSDGHPRYQQYHPGVGGALLGHRNDGGLSDTEPLLQGRAHDSHQEAQNSTGGFGSLSPSEGTAGGRDASLIAGPHHPHRHHQQPQQELQGIASSLMHQQREFSSELVRTRLPPLALGTPTRGSGACDDLTGGVLPTGASSSSASPVLAGSVAVGMPFLPGAGALGNFPMVTRGGVATVSDRVCEQSLLQSASRPSSTEEEKGGSLSAQFLRNDLPHGVFANTTTEGTNFLRPCNNPHLAAEFLLRAGGTSNDEPSMANLLAVVHGEFSSLSVPAAESATVTMGELNTTRERGENEQLVTEPENLTAQQLDWMVDGGEQDDNLMFDDTSSGDNEGKNDHE